MENSLRDGNTRTPYLLPEKPFAGQEATVRTTHRTMNWFKIGKGVRQGCTLSPYLTYMQSISWEKLGWMKHKPNQDCQEKCQ